MKPHFYVVSHIQPAFVTSLPSIYNNKSESANVFVIGKPSSAADINLQDTTSNIGFFDLEGPDVTELSIDDQHLRAQRLAAENGGNIIAVFVGNLGNLQTTKADSIWSSLQKDPAASKHIPGLASVKPPRKTVAQWLAANFCPIS